MTDVVPTDSGSYECRIMVRETVSITHTLLVSQSFSVQVNENSRGFLHIHILSQTSVETKSVVTDVYTDTLPQTYLLDI